MDSVPLVVITGQVPNMLIGKDSFQEIDITGATLSLTKHNYLVRKVEDLAETVKEAIEIAASGRPGPVLIDVPKDVFLALYESEQQENERIVEEKMTPSEVELKEIAELINNAKKPVVYAGGGVRISQTDELLKQLVEKCCIPTANSFMG